MTTGRINQVTFFFSKRNMIHTRVLLVAALRASSWETERPKVLGIVCLCFLSAQKHQQKSLHTTTLTPCTLFFPLLSLLQRPPSPSIRKQKTHSTKHTKRPPTHVQHNTTHESKKSPREFDLMSLIFKKEAVYLDRTQSNSLPFIRRKEPLPLFRRRVMAYSFTKRLQFASLSFSLA